MTTLAARVLEAIKAAERNGRFGPAPTGYVVTDHHGWATAHAPEDVRITYAEGASERERMIARSMGLPWQQTDVEAARRG